MKKIILLILIIFFSVPNLIYAQEFDFSKPTKNTEQTTKSIEKELEIHQQKAKKEKKEKKQLQRLTGNIISLGYGFNKRDAMEDEGDEINIRFHHLLKNINLGFYISPIPLNTSGEVLGSIQFGVSTTILNKLTISAGSDISYLGEESSYLGEESYKNPSKILEIGAMLHLTKKINIEYRYAIAGPYIPNDMYDWEEEEYWDGDEYVPAHMFSVGYNISK